MYEYNYVNLSMIMVIQLSSLSCIKRLTLAVSSVLTLSLMFSARQLVFVMDPFKLCESV